MSRFAALVALSAAVAACGGQKSADAHPTVGFVVANTTLSFSQEMGQGFVAGATSVGGVGATVVGPPIHDGPKQVEIFKTLTHTAKGGIAVAASEPELIARPISEAARDGIPVVAVDVAPAPGSGITLYIGNDNFALGQQLADEAIRRLPPNATGKLILGINAPGVPTLEARAEGVRARFAEKAPGIRVMGPFDTHREVAENKVAWQRLVAANPKAVGFIGTGDVDAFNLAAVHGAGKASWLAGGFGLDPRTLAGVKGGQLFAVASPEHFLKGAIAGWLEAQNAKGAKDLPEGWIYTPGLVVTSANLDEITKRQSSEASKLAWFKPQIDAMTADLTAYLRPIDQAR